MIQRRTRRAMAQAQQTENINMVGGSKCPYPTNFDLLTKSLNGLQEPTWIELIDWTTCKPFVSSPDTARSLYAWSEACRPRIASGQTTHSFPWSDVLRRCVDCKDVEVEHMTGIEDDTMVNWTAYYVVSVSVWRRTTQSKPFTNTTSKSDLYWIGIELIKAYWDDIRTRKYNGWIVECASKGAKLLALASVATQAASTTNRDVAARSEANRSKDQSTTIGGQISTLDQNQKPTKSVAKRATDQGTADGDQSTAPGQGQKRAHKSNRNSGWTSLNQTSEVSDWEYVPSESDSEGSVFAPSKRVRMNENAEQSTMTPGRVSTRILASNVQQTPQRTPSDMDTDDGIQPPRLDAPERADPALVTPAIQHERPQTPDEMELEEEIHDGRNPSFQDQQTSNADFVNPNIFMPNAQQGRQQNSDAMDINTRDQDQGDSDTGYRPANTTRHDNWNSRTPDIGQRRRQVFDSSDDSEAIQHQHGSERQRQQARTLGRDISSVRSTENQQRNPRTSDAVGVDGRIPRYYESGGYHAHRTPATSRSFRNLTPPTSRNMAMADPSMSSPLFERRTEHVSKNSFSSVLDVWSKRDREQINYIEQLEAENAELRSAAGKIRRNRHDQV